MRFLPRMRHHVSLKVAGLGERLATRLAHERAVAGVSLYVIGQLVGRRECLAARLAKVRFLAGVNAHVHSQAAGRRERLAARLADIRPLPRMCPHVHCQGTCLRERMAASLADVRLFLLLFIHSEWNLIRNLICVKNTQLISIYFICFT